MNSDIVSNRRFTPGSAAHRRTESEPKIQEGYSHQTPTRVVAESRLETKIASIWHNMKYGWSAKMRSSFSKEQPVWLLGRCYHRKLSPSSSPLSSMTSSLEIPSKMGIKLQDIEPTLQDTQYDNSEEIEYPSEPAEETGTDAIEDCEGEDLVSGIEGFKRDFVTKIWMTYRREFQTMHDPIDSKQYTSDCGWGCMIRSGQMLLAQALVTHFLGRDWRYDPESQIYTAEDQIHRKILRWFGDQESKNSPFSIHTLVNLGKEAGKRPGDWYGPTNVSYLIKQAVKMASQENMDLASIHVYVSQDSTIYIQDIMDACYTQENNTNLAPWQHHSGSTSVSPAHRIHASTSANSSVICTWKPLILLIPLRLGNEKLNPIYADCLKAMLSLEYCIGIIGGRPKHSLFFVGYQEDKLIHLDPHYCQDMVDVNQENFPVSSFHCKSPRKMKISKMDPSCCIGFYLNKKSDFDKLQSSIQPYLLPTKNYCERQQQNFENLGLEYNYPIFVFSRGRSSEQTVSELPQKIVYRSFAPSTPASNPRRMRTEHHQQSADRGGRSNPYYSADELDDDTEEFVLL